MKPQPKEQAPHRYTDSMAHLLAELRWLDLRIQARIEQMRALHAADDDEFRGLYIAEEEVDLLIARPAGAAPLPGGAGPEPAVRLHRAAAQARAVIARAREESLGRGVSLRLVRLGKLFGLTALDIDIVLLCLAPELDLRYERLYAYLQDDVTKKRPSVDLALGLFCETLGERLGSRRRFSQHAPLIGRRLVNLFHDPAQQEPVLLGQFLRLDPRVADYLLGADEIDPRIRFAASLTRADTPLERLLLPSDLKGRLERLIPSTAPVRPSTVFYFQGPYGLGKRSTAQALCARAGKGLLVVELSRLAAVPEDEFEVLVGLIDREAELQSAALYWKDFDILLDARQEPRLNTLLGYLEARDGLTFVSGETPWEPSDARGRSGFIRVEFAPPDYEERSLLWEAMLRAVPVADGVDPRQLAGRFRFSGGRIRDAVATARNLARWRAPDEPRVEMADLNAACRLQSSHRLGQLTQKVTPRYGWEDIVLPARRLEQLRELVNAARYSPLVYSEWGFGRKLSLGKGLNALFAGPSGTGKTMAAEIVAGELGLDLYRIDLSTVVSKYIGETEKNLSQIFTEAETANAILFFDEADALFGKRSEVRDAHDRYANIEIGYLLQRMEAYEGVVILATNLSKNMDEAFVRRMHFSIEFPFPDERDRRRIWQGIWPDETPTSPELDFGLLATRFELAGGNIKNAALAAAFLAADDGRMVGMSHLIRAVRREYEKMGKVTMESEFAEYAHLLTTP